MATSTHVARVVSIGAGPEKRACPLSVPFSWTMLRCNLGASPLQYFSAAARNWTAISPPFGSPLLLREVGGISQSMYNPQTGAISPRCSPRRTQSSRPRSTRSWVLVSAMTRTAT